MLAPAEVTTLASDVLGTRIVEAEHLPVGFANDSWRVTTSTEERFTVKFGPLRSEAKWRSAQRAHDLAAQAGVPVAPLVHTGTVGAGTGNGGAASGRLIRVFRWIEGRTPTAESLRQAGLERLFTDLGSAVATLHRVTMDAFSSRLDGSAPPFERWSDYLEQRLVAVRARCRATAAFDDVELDRACAAITALAREVSDVARPTLCHRDLHADNLLVDATGRLVAVLDFDTAEIWDLAGERHKLERLLFPAFPEGRRWFDAAYMNARPEPQAWDERRRVVDLIESLNAVPNALVHGDTAYAERASRWLRDALRD